MGRVAIGARRTHGHVHQVFLQPLHHEVADVQGSSSRLENSDSRNLGMDARRLDL